MMKVYLSNRTFTYSIKDYLYLKHYATKNCDFVVNPEDADIIVIQIIDEDKTEINWYAKLYPEKEIHYFKVLPNLCFEVRKYSK
jgi:hypothetical protein